MILHCIGCGKASPDRNYLDPERGWVCSEHCGLASTQERHRHEADAVASKVEAGDFSDFQKTKVTYERFTDRARRVMQLANQEAQRFNHEYIGTEHILLGLVKEGTGVAANVLKNLDIDLRKIRLEVEKIVQAGPDMVTMGKLPQTPRAKKVIEYSIEEARTLNHNYVGTEHLLLGLLREQEGVAAQVLMNLGLKLEDVRAEVLFLLAGHSQANDDLRQAVAPLQRNESLAAGVQLLPGMMTTIPSGMTHHPAPSALVHIHEDLYVDAARVVSVEARGDGHMPPPFNEQARVRVTFQGDSRQIALYEFITGPMSIAAARQLAQEIQQRVNEGRLGGMNLYDREGRPIFPSESLLDAITKRVTPAKDYTAMTFLPPAVRDAVIATLSVDEIAAHRADCFACMRDHGQNQLAKNRQVYQNAIARSLIAMAVSEEILADRNSETITAPGSVTGDGADNRRKCLGCERMTSAPDGICRVGDCCVITRGATQYVGQAGRDLIAAERKFVANSDEAGKELHKHRPDLWDENGRAIPGTNALLSACTCPAANMLAEGWKCTCGAAVSES